MYICKNGLVYSKDLRIVLGVDTSAKKEESSSGKSFLTCGEIPYGAKYIEDEVFSDCPYENIFLPDSMEGIGAALFENSLNLRTVKLPANITELPPYLFSGCKKLYKVTMPNILAPDGFSEALFKNCSSLEEIPFRAGIKELPAECICGCTSVRSLVIPPTVEFISDRAVADCTSLLSLVLPASLDVLADNAFEGCKSLRNIRISDDNPKFYVNEDDGCLYERNPSDPSKDKLKIAVAGIEKSEVSFFNEELAAGTISENDSIISDDSDLFMSDVILEQDDDFSAEIQAEEIQFCTDDSEMENEIESENNNENYMEIGANALEKEMIMNDEFTNDEMTDNSVTDAAVSEIFAEKTESANDLSSQLADIMEEEDEISASEPDEEISVDELDKLFSSDNTLKSVEEVAAEKAAQEEEIDGKTKILLDSVELSKIIKCEPVGEVPENGELYVVAEKTVTGPDGSQQFTAKLEEYCKKVAKNQDYKKIIMLSGLPVDNDEFVQFYHFYMTQKHILFACEAPSPSKLSDYGKKVCELSRISLAKDDLIEQSKNISVKNNSLVKFVIQDKYN